MSLGFVPASDSTAHERFRPSWRRLRAAALTSGVLLAAAGCGGSGLPLASVSGRVTLDGQPLPDAVIEFQPAGGGAPSYGLTDSEGRYDLQFSRHQPGALPGEHKVRIRTARAGVDEQGNEVPLPEKIPAHYNARTELTATVDDKGSKIDFELEGARQSASRTR